MEPDPEHCVKQRRMNNISNDRNQKLLPRRLLGDLKTENFVRAQAVTRKTPQPAGNEYSNDCRECSRSTSGEDWSERFAWLTGSVQQHHLKEWNTASIFCQPAADGVVAHNEQLQSERPPRRFAPPLLCKEGIGNGFLG